VLGYNHALPFPRSSCEHQPDPEPHLFTVPDIFPKSYCFERTPVFDGSLCSVAMLSVWVLQLVRLHHSTDLLAQDVLSFLKHILLPKENLVPNAFSTIRTNAAKVGCRCVPHRYLCMYVRMCTHIMHLMTM
jgi:hypothetical protein